MSTGTTQARGYGHTHQQLRKQWAKQVTAGGVKCWRCSEPIAPDEPWDLGHSDDRTVYRGPEHRACNRGAAGRIGGNLATMNRAMTVREW